MDERRKFFRVAFAIETCFTYQNQPYQGEVRDLSLKGMFVKTIAQVAIDQILRFTIHLSGDNTDFSMQLNGVVVRITPEGLGIRFEPIDLESFTHLKNIVSYNSQNVEDIDNEFLDFIKENIKQHNS